MSQDIVGVMTRAGGLEALRELKAGVFGTDATLRAWKLPFTPSPTTPEAAFEAAEADFVGYAAVPLTYGDIGIDAAGRAMMASQNATFQADDDTTPNNIGGVWIHVDDVGPPAVDAPVLYFPFPSPVSMSEALAMFGFKVIVTAPNLNSYGILES